MYKGAFRIWEGVLGIGGAALAVAYSIAGLAFPDIFSMRYLIVCFMAAAAALFPRPIWLAASWRRLSRYAPLSVTVTNDLPINTAAKGGNRRHLVTLKFKGKKKRRFERTLSDGILFMRHIEGSQYEAFVDPERPDEFVVMPAGRTNAVVFAAAGVVIEVALAVWLQTL
ncbi:MAG: hypothetical protein NC299_02545 [Lachnospiraceae bacterium]|nr:hypothetical protein [Ruminococcus sp.]MCM1274229.1 hypothetical protein [Lachnospiraceae bacterium]